MLLWINRAMDDPGSMQGVKRLRRLPYDLDRIKQLRRTDVVKHFAQRLAFELF